MLERIIKEFELKTGILVTSKTRQHYVVIHRAMWCLVLRQEGYTLQMIADLFERDHSTVLHAIKKAQFEVEFYPLAKKAYKTVLEFYNKIKEQYRTAVAIGQVTNDPNYKTKFQDLKQRWEKTLNVLVLTPNELDPLAETDEVIELKKNYLHHLIEADIVIVCSDYEGSEWCKMELELMEKLNKTIIKDCV